MSLSPEIQQQRYASIELAYSERRWPEVESLSQALLQELAPEPGDPVRMRLVLLLGHTRLYGLGDTATARGYYASVLQHGRESTLLEIAQQGLEQCQQLDQSLQQPAQEPPTTTALANSPSVPAGSRGLVAAAPWLADSGSHDPAGPVGGSRPGSDAAPWLSQVAEAEPAPPQSTALPELTEPATPAPQALELHPGAEEPEAPTPHKPENAAPVASAEPTPLVAEIIEEPEQIAVALADPGRRDEVTLDLVKEPAEVSQPAAAAALSSGPLQAPLAFDERALSPEELAELSRGLLRICLPSGGGSS
ncbi:MAG: hypothetical protein VKM34_04505 [Cyanobacteriota bacterium]|nr:hypothetical protein [Cyanobacteriota bacterium]